MNNKKINIWCCILLGMLLSFGTKASDMQIAICVKVVEHYEGKANAAPILSYLESSGSTSRQMISKYMESAETIIRTDPEQARKVYQNFCKAISREFNR